MRTMRRTLFVLLVVPVLLTACGDDEDTTPATTPSTAPTTTVAQAAPSTTVPATVARNVTDGAVCPTPNARGTTQAGLPMVCAQVAGGNETRWRPA